MKKILLILLFILFPINVFAENEINIYFFHADGCSNCEVMETCINNLEEKYLLNVIKYQVRDNEENMALMDKVKTTMSDKNLSGVPFIALGNKYVYGGSEYKCQDLENYVKEYSNGDYVDVIASIINDNYVEEAEEEVVVINKDDNSNDVIDILKNPKIIAAILLIVAIFLYYFTMNKENLNVKEGTKEDEKKK